MISSDTIQYEADRTDMTSENGISFHFGEGLVFIRKPRETTKTLDLYLAWDYSGRCYCFNQRPRVSEDVWVSSNDDLRDFPWLDDQCPFNSWDERYLDLNVKSDLQLVLAMVSL